MTSKTVSEKKLCTWLQNEFKQAKHMLTKYAFIKVESVEDSQNAYDMFLCNEYFAEILSIKNIKSSSVHALIKMLSNILAAEDIGIFATLMPTEFLEKEEQKKQERRQYANQNLNLQQITTNKQEINLSF